MKVAKSHPAQIYLWAKKSKQLTVEIFGTKTETECYSHPFTTKKPRNQRHILIFFELLLP